jgi:DNA-binding GntR family transcriptional regulator
MTELAQSRQSPPNFKAVVAERVRQDIFQARLKPGQKIDQDDLADQLGISKLPVREAVILLENEGLVDNFPRRGCYVAALTCEDIRDHYLLIGLVSGLAARRAASVVTAESLAHMRAILDRLAQSSDPAEQERLNDDFHRMINRLSGGRRLQSALRLFTQTMPRHFFDFTSGWGSESQAAHEKILQALMDHDPDAAEEAVRQHMIRGAEAAVENLRAAGFWD